MASSSAQAMTATESIGSKSPSTGFTAPDQMEVDSFGSNEREDLQSPRDVTSQPSATNTTFVEQELIPKTSRLSRLPAKVPSSTQPSTGHSTGVAISAFPYHTTNTSTGQDVHFFVNNSASSISSTATPSIGQPSTPLEASVSSFSQPITQHGLKHPIRRPRTSSSVFQSSTDLAAHYGIPQRLPPAPRTNTRYQPQPSLPPKESPEIANFKALSANYLNMLSNKPTDNTVAASSTTTMTTAISPAELDAPPVPSAAENQALQELAAMLGENTASSAVYSMTHIFGTAITASSPEFRDVDSFEAFMTSPMPDLDTDFGYSPDETPFNDFLNTPLITDEALLNSPYMNDLPMFAMPDFDKVDESAAVQVQAPAPFPSALYTISPESPMLHSFDNHNYETPKSVAPSAGPATRRTSKATGIRKGITPDALLDESAPTQPRKYATPSATSKKEVPATFARKRARSTAFGDDEEDQLPEDLPLNPTEKDLIEAKRRQNTVAARRSRKRKLEQFQMMEKSRDEERRLKEQWQDRANMLLEVIRGMGVSYPDFPPDQTQYSNA